MKKTILTIIILLAAAPVFAQTNHPDAEYNLIRRSYKTNSDGSMDIRFRKELVLLRNRAITAYADKGETFITYNPDFETLTVNESYTIRPEGTRVNTLHRNATFLAERFNLNQDCPVKSYEIRYADGHTQVLNNLPQTVNDPYMPAKKGYDIEFQLGEKPVYTAQTTLPAAVTLLNSLRKDNAKDYVAAIRDWVVDYVTLNPVDPARVNYAMAAPATVFADNCGTVIDKTGLLAALLNQAGFRATIVDNSISVFGDKPLEVEVTIEGNKYRLTATHKTPLLTETEKADAAAVAAAPVYVDRHLDWAPDTIVDNYVRISLPNEHSNLNIDPAKLNPSRTSDVQAGAVSEFYHYTLDLPKGAKLIGGDINIEYNRTVGSISIIVKQKGRRLLVTRSLRLRKAVVTRAEYADFRQLMIDWNSHRQLYFSL